MMQIRRVQVCTVLRAFVSELLLSMAIVPWVVTAALAGTFTSTGSMTAARFNHTATLLNNGKVLVTGGSGVSSTLASADVYDPSTKLFSATAGPMATARESHTATLLNNGKVLIAGGWNSFTGTVLNTAELYDPTTNSFSSAGFMTSARAFHTATLLSSGKVLLAGGEDSGGTHGNAELYDPNTGFFTAVTLAMTSAREFHTATLLNNGQVLLAGGWSGSSILASAELYNPNTNSFSATAGPMGTARDEHTATLLTNGQVLLAGGSIPPLGHPDASAELYNPNTNSFSATAGPMATAREFHTATLLKNGQVLVAGGFGSSGTLSSAELYNPNTNTFSATAGPMVTARESHTATLVLFNRRPGSQVLIAGGFGASILATAELYTP